MTETSDTTGPDLLRPPRLPRPDQIANMGRIAFGVAASALLRRPVVAGSPAMLMVEPTTACQLRCPHCPTGRGELTRPAASMSLDDFRAVWDDIRPAPVRLQLWNQGEPLVNRDTPAIVRHATASGARVVLATNVELLARGDLAERLVRAGLAELVLSLDGASAESHTTYRIGGDFALVEQGVKRVAEVKRSLGVRHPTVTWQYLLFRHNLNEVERARELARVWEADRIVFKTAQLEAFDEEEGRRWLPERRSLRRYDLRGGRWVLRRRERPFCARIHGSAVVQADGDVVPCCFDKEGRFVVGNAVRQPLRQWWRGGAFQRFRRRILSGERPPMCTNCTEGLRYLHARPGRE